LVKVIAILGVIKTCTCSYTRSLHYVFWYPTVARILTHSVNLACGLNRASKINVRMGSGLGFRFRASKWDPFTTLVQPRGRQWMGAREASRAVLPLVKHLLRK